MIKSKNTKKPCSFDYEDYRTFLRDMVAYLKSNHRQFTYRYFSKKAGFSSPNFLKLVAEGQRNLSHRSIGKFARALRLPEKEQEDFENLVLFNQAQSDVERNRLYSRLRKGRSETPQTKLTAEQYDVYSLWYALPIREMMLLPDFQEDPEWIAKHLRPRIRPVEAKRALRLLEKIGLARRDEAGKLQPQAVSLATGPAAPLAVRNYHRAMLEHAASSLDGLPVEERNITSVTVPLKRSQYEEVCRRISELRDSIMELSCTPEDPSLESSKEEQQVYVVGFQAFPISERKE